jgi:hypothetical protein
MGLADWSGEAFTGLILIKGPGLDRTLPYSLLSMAAYTGCFCVKKLVIKIAIMTPALKGNLTIELVN